MRRNVQQGFTAAAVALDCVVELVGEADVAGGCGKRN